MPRAKRHKPSLIFTSLAIFTSLTFITRQLLFGLVALFCPSPPSSQSHSVDKYGCQYQIRYQVLYLYFAPFPHPVLPKSCMTIMDVNVISGIRSCCSILPRTQSSQSHACDKYGCQYHIRYYVLQLIFAPFPHPSLPKSCMTTMDINLISGIRSCSSILPPSPILPESCS